MAKYKVDWSIEAKSDLFYILDFYYRRNGNKTYSRQLNAQINESIKLIAKNPFIGLKTNIKTVRALVTRNYQIIYEIINDQILIVMIWDNRRDPEQLLIHPTLQD